METEQFLGRFMFASCSLQGTNKNIGFCGFGVKTTCGFYLKNAKSWWWKDEMTERGRCSLGTVLVQLWYDPVLIIFFFICVKSRIFWTELINIQLLSKKLSTFVNYNEIQNKCNLFVINFIIRVKCFSFKRLYFYTFSRVKHVIRNCLSCFWIKSMHK